MTAPRPRAEPVDDETVLGGPSLDDELPASLRLDPGTRGSVLVVETDPHRPVARALTELGFGVRVTDDGVAATQLLASAPFEALVSDLSPRDLGGLALLRFVREEDPDIPVVLMGASPDVSTALEAMELGAFQFLSLPAPYERMRETVERAVVTCRIARQRSDAQRAFEELPTIETREANRGEWESALARLWMAYQPIVLPSGELYAYEALVRSDEPALRHPGELLDMAEKLGELRALGRRIRELAGQRAVRAAGAHHLFVNLHAEDLLDERLVSPLEALSHAAKGVVLEITERAALHDVDEAKAKMTELRGMGFRVALDDLGAGYAGLTSFAALRPDVVKLDMALVRGIDEDRVKRKLVASVIEVSRDIGTTVVGEGVETPRERDVLLELGCHLLQGFLYGRPERI